MKITIVFATIVMLLNTSTTSAFRCGPEIIIVGDSKSRVLELCGQPDSKDIRKFDSGTRRDSKNKSEPVYTIETWTYERGSLRSRAQLHFSGNKIVRIEERSVGN